MNTIEIKTDFSGEKLQHLMWDLEAFCDNKGIGKPVLRQADVSGSLPLAEIIGYLERLKHYLSSGSTYCFDNEHDLNDSEELEKFINSLRQ